MGTAKQAFSVVRDEQVTRAVYRHSRRTRGQLRVGGESAISRITPKRSTAGNLCQPGSVNRDEEQLKLAPRFDETMNSCSQKEKRRHMALGLSVVGGLFLAGFAFYRLKARRAARKDVLKLFS